MMMDSSGLPRQACIDWNNVLATYTQTTSNLLHLVRSSKAFKVCFMHSRQHAARAEDSPQGPPPSSATQEALQQIDEHLHQAAVLIDAHVAKQQAVASSVQAIMQGWRADLVGRLGQPEGLALSMPGNTPAGAGIVRVPVPLTFPTQVGHGLLPPTRIAQSHPSAPRPGYGLLPPTRIAQSHPSAPRSRKRARDHM